MATGQYALVKDLIDQIQNPSHDLQMMFHYAMYHIIYDQAEEEEKAVESLYRIA
ncbi:hypothetical protein [Paenibacillus sp. FSL R7-0652]|uniref:hypothetical protein n=1 Tax=Paenibacillus sp. FSL R7-0652 TaxID=2921687 RepID=UPI00315A08A3